MNLKFRLGSPICVSSLARQHCLYDNGLRESVKIVAFVEEEKISELRNAAKFSVHKPHIRSLLRPTFRERPLIHDFPEYSCRILCFFSKYAAIPTENNANIIDTYWRLF